MAGKVVAVCRSDTKGVQKTPVESVQLMADHGVAMDAHAGPWHRQVSLLAIESVDKMRAKGLNVNPGDFAENITTQGLDLPSLPIGTRLCVGEAVLSVSQIGKECHTRCAIYHQAGDCVMPREGIFAEVLRGGVVTRGQKIERVNSFVAKVITLSDRCYRQEAVDESGPALATELALLGAEVEVILLPDEADELESVLKDLVSTGGVDLVLTTGGTGMGPRDITPEATERVVERLVPGIAEAIRMESIKVTPNAMLSRGIAGTAGKTLIVNLPGSLKGSQESYAVLKKVLPHALEVISGYTLDCGRA